MDTSNRAWTRWFSIGQVLLLGAFFCTTSGCGKSEAEAAGQPTPKVTVTAVVSRQTSDADEYTGYTEASEQVDVRARVFGYLKGIKFKDGDFVTAGQTLFTIEPDEYQAIYDQSLSRIDLNTAQLELAKSKLARNEKLLRSQAISQEEYEETLASVKEAQAKITAAKADANRTKVDLDHTVLKSPINGRIDRALVTEGNLLTGGTSSGTLLTKIVQEQPMYVYFDVDERSLLRYMRQRGAPAETTPGSLRDLKIPCYAKLADETEFKHLGELDFASNEVHAGTGTARIRGIFANAKREMASGMYVRVQIPVSKPYQALMIPEQALASDQSVKFVYVVGDDSTAQRRSVTLGGQRGDMRIVTAGLEANERVIVKGMQRVKPGQKVDAELAKVTAPLVTAPPAAAQPPPAPAEPTPTPAQPTRPTPTPAPPAPASERPAPAPSPPTPASADSRESASPVGNPAARPSTEER